MYGLETLQGEYSNPEDNNVGLGEYCDIDITVNNIDIPWKLPTLICQDIKNQTRIWEIAFDGVDLITTHGTVNGQKQEVKRAITLNNSGKDIYQQALVEGKKRYQDKIREGYHGVGYDTGFKKPMRADHFDKHLKKVIGDHNLVYQYKIDGERALTSYTSLGIVRLSRNNNPIPFQEHLDQECYQLLSYLPQGTILDGELYKHGMPFEEISGRCSVGRKDPHYDREVIEYWIFDIITQDSLTYIERYNLLCEAYNQCVGLTKLVMMPVFQCYGSLDSIMEHLKYAESIGYEGIMLKNPSSKYIHGKTCNMLKVKKFIDEEAIIVGVTSGKGTESGCALFILYDGLTGKQFPVRPSGTFDQRRYWFTYPTTVIGRFYTFKYFGERKPGQLPRFPIGMRFRDEL